MDRKFQVLFLCSWNAARSQMAEAFLRAAAVPRVEVQSAGVTPRPIPPLALKVMQELGIDLSGQRPKSVADLGRRTFDLIITLCADSGKLCTPAGTAEAVAAEQAVWEAKQSLFVGVPLHLHWPIEDPTLPGGTEEEQLSRFRRVRDELRARIAVLLEQGYLAALEKQRLLAERLIDALEDGVIAHDDFRRIFVFNHAAERVTGLQREDVLGRDCYTVFPPDGLCGGQCDFREGGAGECAFTRGEYQVNFTTPDGRAKRLKVLRLPLAVQDGQPHGVVALVRDETEVRELRWKLRKEKSFHGMIGASKPMQEVFETIRLTTSSDYPVLITGESGTGKELVANAIHNESRRGGGPFVPINCGALPENILESELFGHVRGAFTGAIRTKKGRFELADHGTLFLDEVSELTPAFQVKLLRVLQEQRFEMVGGEQPITVDVRIVSATNRDLRQLVREGKFREDLFYRLCVVPIHLPPLRERKADLPSLVEHFLKAIRQETGKPLRGVADEALAALLRYDWPGNIRELINALQFAAVRCAGEVLQEAHLPPEVRAHGGGGGGGGADPAIPSPLGERESAGPAETVERGRSKKLTREAVEQALAAAGGKKVQAARLLGVGRATLYRFLDENKMHDAVPPGA